MSALAAIDCGTNSTRLLIVDDGRTVERLMRITRLGQGVDATGRLAPEAIERTTSVLAEYREVMDQHGVERVRMTATSAARDADNREDFFVAAEHAVGVRPELLSGLEEGRLSFAGATAELDPADGPFLVVDIGGGSTEFAVGTEECEGAMSIDIGCVRLTEKFLDHDPPRADELSACLSVVQTYLDDVARDLPAAPAAQTFVGLAGTVSTVAAVELGLAEYDRDCHPSPRAVPRGGGGRLSHSGDRDPGPTTGQPRDGGGASRRDRRWLLHPGQADASVRPGHLPGVRGRHPRRSGGLHPLT